MSLNDLPTEMITKILSFLVNDTKGFIGLSSTCRRFNDAAKDLVNSDAWAGVRGRAITYYIKPEKHYIKGEDDEKHNYCYHNYYSPEGKLKLKSDYQFGEDEGWWLECERYIHRCYNRKLFSWLNAKHRNFSALKFYLNIFTTTSCLRAIEESRKLNKIMTEQRMREIAELNLNNCDITLNWLNTILNLLVNISYLILNDVLIEDEDFTLNSKSASKYLKLLKINNGNINNDLFKYFLDNFPSNELIISEMNLLVHHYGFVPIVDLNYAFTKLLSYLKKHQAAFKQITIKNCEFITEKDKTDLEKKLGKEELARVTFHFINNSTEK